MLDAMMPGLALSLLGPFQASAGDRPITNFATDKVRALLAYLAVEADRPHRRDTLAALLWPNWDDRAARGNLRLALHRLREALDAADPALSDAIFGITRETVQINAAAVAVDVARFVSLLEMCESHPHRLLHLCPSCLAQLDEAAALYSGELLAGLSIADAPAFEQWELLRREELAQRVMALLYRLADAFEQLGDPARALLFAHRQLALDPYREEAHRQVIRGYARQGQRAAALAHYDRARRLLADELGVEPDPATVDLVEQVRAGRPTPTNGHGAADERPLLYHFPARFTPFFGRAAEIGRLVDRLASDEGQRRGAGGQGRRGEPATRHAPPATRLLTIVAPGGMGKTRLAIAAAEALGERPGFPGGIYFIPLAKTAAADQLPSAVAAALNVQLGGAADPAEQLIAYLRPLRALLVLDNFEHLLDGVDLLLRLLEGAPGLSLLVTSREALNVRGEERFVLGGLEDDAAMTLFVGAAARLLPGYAPGPADGEAIRAIVRDVGGMPLAVELAATWVRLMDAPAIAARIRADLDFLSTTLRDLPERQRSMRAVFDYMWQTLSPPERAALAMLSVLRGPFRLDAAEAIAGAAPAALALLLDQALLRAAGGGRFELHELLRQYAAGKLAADPAQAAAAHERHAAHYLALLTARGAALGGPESKEALAGLRRNFDNVRAAWGWAVDGGHVAEIERALPALEAYYRFSGLSAEGAAMLAATSAALEDHIRRGDAQPQAVYPVIYEIMRREALLLELHGAGEAALARLEKAQAGWAALGDRVQVVRVLCEIGYVNVRHFWSAHTREQLTTTLALAREVGDDGLIAAALHNQGNTLAWHGDMAGGRALLEESLDHYRAAGETRWLAGTLNDIGMTYAFGDDQENARAFFRQSLSISENLGDQPGIAMAASNLGAIALDAGDPVEAEAFSRRGQATAQDIGDRLMLSVSVGNLGHAALARGDRAAALRYYQDTVALSREGGYTFMLIEAVLGLSALAVAPDAPAVDAPAAARWLAAVAAWRVAGGFTVETPYIRALREGIEARLRAALGSRVDALWSETPLPIETAAAEAAAWATGERDLRG